MDMIIAFFLLMIAVTYRIFMTVGVFCLICAVWVGSYVLIIGTIFQLAASPHPNAESKRLPKQIPVWVNQSESE